jgi:hypothetical protein
MSNWGYDDNDSTQAGNNLDGPKALREAYDKLKSQNEELNAKLTSFLESQETQKVASVFESLGVPGAQEHYKGDANPEAIASWVNNMKATFGGQVAPATEVHESVQPTLTPEQQGSFQSFMSAGDSAEQMTRYEAANTEIKGKSPDEILAFWTGGKI